MAMKHRKLFPTSTNQTDCPEFCDPTSTCPYGCYPYPYPYPDFYFFQPPQPLPPPPTDQGQNLSSHVIIIVSVLTTVFLLLSYYLIIVKYCFRRARLESDGQDWDYVDENQGSGIDHHIWFINTIGLQPSLINKITVFKFRKSDVLTEGTDCSVCLSEFQEDETLRLLPKCNHAFHIPCIDTWLRSHTNCPLCRAGILSNTWSVINPSASDEQNSINLRPEEQTQIENSERNGELRENRSETEGGISLTQVDGEGNEIDDSKDQNSLNLTPDVVTQMENSESNGELGEKMAETDDETGLLHANDKRKKLEDSKDGGTSNGCGVFPVVELEVRRSASMEFSSAVTVNSADCTEDSPQSNMGIVPMQDLENSKMNEVIGRDTSSQSLNNGSVSLKRSFSYGGRMFLPRHSRNLSSILPL